MDEKECYICDEPLRDSWSVCPNCGYPAGKEELFKRIISLEREQQFLFSTTPCLFFAGMKNVCDEGEMERIGNRIGNDDLPISAELFAIAAEVSGVETSFQNPYFLQ